MSDGTFRVHAAGEGAITRFFADHIAVKEQRTELDIWEAVIHAGCEPPLHVHQREEEWIYVIQGAITAFLESEEIAIPTGSTAFLPRGVPHTYAVDTGEARVLAVNSPGGFAGMFADLAVAYRGEMPDAPGPEAGELMTPVFDAYGIATVGPNPRYA
jgi:quercetin dioxygenase-like cupin family protein